MIGFFAQYVAGVIQIDAEELEGADWYDFRQLPPLPPPLSLSRQMIDAWAQSRRSAAAQTDRIGGLDRHATEISTVGEGGN